MKGKNTKNQELQCMSEGQFGGTGEKRAPRNEELLMALKIYSFEVSQKTDPAELGITTVSQAPPEFISARNSKKPTY